MCGFSLKAKTARHAAWGGGTLLRRTLVLRSASYAVVGVPKNGQLSLQENFSALFRKIAYLLRKIDLRITLGECGYAA